MELQGILCELQGFLDYGHEVFISYPMQFLGSGVNLESERVTYHIVLHRN